MHEFTVNIGDAIQVGPCRVKVDGISRGAVKLAFTAPKEVRILRDELVGREPKQKAEPDAV